MDIWFCSSRDTWCVLPIAERISGLSNCGVFRNFKGVYVEQTTFLENGNITPQAQAFLVRFEIWKVLNYVGPEVFLEKRIIIPRAIFCVCHGFVASFRSANHFDANTNLAEPHPTDISSNSLLSSQTTVTIVESSMFLRVFQRPDVCVRTDTW